MSRTDSPMEQDATLVEPFTREDVMKRTVPWRNYAEAGLITAKDLELITEFDKKEPDVQQDMLSNVCVLNTLVLSFTHTHAIITFFSQQERKGKKYVTLLFTVLGKINTVEPLQYVVALLNELVDGSTDRVLALYTEVSKTMDIYTPLFSFVPSFTLSFSANSSFHVFFHLFYSAIRRVDSDWFLNKEASNLLRLLLWFVLKSPQPRLFFFSNLTFHAILLSPTATLIRRRRKKWGKTSWSGSRRSCRARSC